MAPPRPFDDVSDHELAAQCAWLRRVAARLLRDPGAAEDAAQDAWLALRRRGEVAPTRPRMAAIVRNLARRGRRAEERRAARERRVARPEAALGPDEVADALERQRVLVEELQALPTELRDLLVLRTYAERSAADIARDRGLAESTVRDRLARAEALLRERLDRRFGGQRERWAALLDWMPRTPLPPPQHAAPSTIDSAVLATVAKALLTMKTTTKLALVAVPLCVLALRWDGVGGPHVPSADAVARPHNARVADVEAPEAAVVAGGLRTTVAPREGAARPAPAADGALELHVRDGATRAPAPFYAVELLDDAGARVGLVETDAHGRASVPAEQARRAQRLRAIDHVDLVLRRPAEVALVDLDAPLAFDVDLGPSYDLVLPSLALPVSVGAFLATQRVFTDPVRQRLYERGAPLRSGPQPWVRFDPEEARAVAATGAPAFVTLRDREGLWQASGAAPSLAGHAPTPVFLEGGECGLLHGTVTVDGVVPRSPIDVHLTRKSDTFDPERDLRVHLVGAEGQWWAGEFESPYLAVGEWTLNLRGVGLERGRQVVEVLGGAPQALRIDLARATGRRALTVIVDSESGAAPLGLVGAVARRVDGAGEPIHTPPLDMNATGAKQLLVEGLTPGRWTISLTGIEGLAPFAPGRSLEVDADDGEARFTCRDGGVDWTPRVLQAIDAASGAPPSAAAFTVWVNGVALLSRGLAGGECDLPPLYPGARVDLAVHAQGYRAQLLRDVALPREGPLVVQLEPGWGTVLVAQGIEQEATPLAGVRITVDGAPQGVTDAQGRLLLTADRQPTELRCVLEGWRVFAGAVDPATGALTSPGSLWTSDVLLRRE